MKQLMFAWVLCITVFNSNAQQAKIDTLVLDFSQAKDLMIKQNLELIASRYDVDMADAEVIQAKLWSNPRFVWNQDLYSNEKNKYFQIGFQRLVQIEQVFSIAGTHTNTVKLAKLGVELSKLQLQDVLRSLFYDLGEHFYTLEAAEQKQELLEETVLRYDQLIRNAEDRQRVGAMAANEVLRLKSEQIAVRSDATQNKNEVLAELSDLRVLLNLNENVYVRAVRETLPAPAVVVVDQLIDEALEHRADLQLNKTQINYQTQNLKLQKSLSVPDFKVAYQPHDRGSNYVRPYQGWVWEFDIPVFNRNQGNIKTAKYKISQAETLANLSEVQVRNEVASSYAQYINSKEGFEGYSSEFLKATDDLNTNANQNYAKKNINLLEFIDLQRIYIINKTQYIDLRNAYLKSVNQLNFTVGHDIIQ
jgi:outer membrane protein, heavy metal efflux system